MKILLVCLIVCFIILFAGCKEVKEAKMEEKISYRQLEANNIVGRIAYVKDPRTNLCFACIEQYGGGLGMVVVPEEKIPKDLLQIADISKLKEE